MWFVAFRHVRRKYSSPARRTHAAAHSFTFRPRLEALENRWTPTAGAIDPTFGNGAGYVTTSLSTFSDTASSVFVQPDGKILATGGSGATTSAGLVRYNTDGSLDGSFGTGGVMFAPTGTGAAAALYPVAGTANDGKIVLPGPGSGAHAPPASAPNMFSVVRLNADGSLDTSFGTNGTATATFPAKIGGTKLGSSGVSRVLIQPDGKIVGIGVSADIQSIELARFNADGSVDTTFGQSGLVYTSLGTQQIGAVRLMREANGDLVAAMTASTGNTLHIELIGYHADGSLNITFGNGGIVYTPPFGDGFDALGDATLYPATGTANDGKIVVVGYSFLTLTVDSAWLIARYNADGTLDSTFGVGGEANTNLTPRSDAASGVAIQSDGKLVITGSSSGSNLIPTLARFNTNGSLDNMFGAGGVITSPVGSVTSESDLAVQSDGNIVVAGAAVDGTKGTNKSFAVLRYLGHATGPSFVVTGPSSVTAGTPGTFTLAVLNPDGTADTGYTGTVHVTSSDPQAVLPGDYTFTATDQGVQAFTATLKTAGAESLTATDIATGSITGSQIGILVHAAAATHFAISAPASVSKGTAFSITVTALDAYGNVATGYAGTVHFSSSDASATLPANYTFAVADAGVHTFSNKVTLRKKGTQTLTVTDVLNVDLTSTNSIIVV